MKGLFGAALLATLLATASMASADAFDAAMARAAAAKEKALDANDPASWEEALRLFQEADAVRQTKESKYEVATAAAWLKQDDLAVEAFEDAIGLGLDGPARTKADAFVAERSSKLARLRLGGPTGARVSIEGRARGKLPRAAPWVIFAGTAHLKVEHEGRSSERELTSQPGEVLTVDVTAELTKPEPPPTPPVSVPKPPPTPTRSDGSRLTGYGLLVGGGVVALAGVSTWILASGRIDHYDEIVRGYCGDYDGAYCRQIPAERAGDLASAQAASNSVATWRAVRTTGIVALAVGAVTAATGAVIVVGGGGGKDKGPAVALRPSISAWHGGASLSLQGVF